MDKERVLKGRKAFPRRCKFVSMVPSDEWCTWEEYTWNWWCETRQWNIQVINEADVIQQLVSTVSSDIEINRKTLNVQISW